MSRRIIQRICTRAWVLAIGTVLIEPPSMDLDHDRTRKEQFARESSMFHKRATGGRLCRTRGKGRSGIDALGRRTFRIQEVDSREFAMETRRENVPPPSPGHFSRRDRTGLVGVSAAEAKAGGF